MFEKLRRLFEHRQLIVHVKAYGDASLSFCCAEMHQTFHEMNSMFHHESPKLEVFTCRCGEHCELKFNGKTLERCPYCKAEVVYDIQFKMKY